jgi:capsular polysaccharide export protein
LNPVIEALPPGTVLHAHGITLRKRPILARFVGRDHRLRFVSHGAEVPPGAVLLLWGSQPAPEGLPDDVRLVRLEDGFLRSVGLGADLVRPLSWVMDTRGIYYDATRPSDLEHLLQTAKFPPELLERAARLRRRIVASELTKYNVGSGDFRRPSGAGRVILVPGQVESDASIRCGAPGINTNLGLLQAVRRANPDAHLLYKPHPDVVAGLRAQGRGEDEAAAWCDTLLGDVPMGKLLAEVDEVHVLTSLTGFEALLRERRVVCYGQPFYAGWGLTADILPPERRARRLELDALVAGTLILYPIYLGRTGNRPISPEEALDELLDWRAGTGPNPPLWRVAFRVLLRLVVGVR